MISSVKSEPCEPADQRSDRIPFIVTRHHDTQLHVLLMADTILRVRRYKRIAIRRQAWLHRSGTEFKGEWTSGHTSLDKFVLAAHP